MPAAITLHNLSKSYDGKPAVDHLDLTVERGEFFGFLGPNGAGKTTTIRILTGILQPDAGEITIDGLGLDQRHAIAKRIGLMPESRGYYEWMTAKEYLDFFAALYGLPAATRRSTIDDLLQKVSLLPHRQQQVGTFSRGMKQRLGLARALVNKPTILLLDEPTLGLDPQGQADIHALLQELNRAGVTILFSSHLLAEVATLCTRIAILHHGKLVSEGTLEGLRQQTQMAEGYLITFAGNPSADLTGGAHRTTTTTGNTELAVQGSLKSANELVATLQSKGHTLLDFRADGDSLTSLFLRLTKD